MKKQNEKKILKIIKYITFFIISFLLVWILQLIIWWSLKTIINIGLVKWWFFFYSWWWLLCFWLYHLYAYLFKQVFKLNFNKKIWLALFITILILWLIFELTPTRMVRTSDTTTFKTIYSILVILLSIILGLYIKDLSEDNQ